MIEVANYIDQAIKLAVEINKSNDEKKSSPLTLKDFKEKMQRNEYLKNIQNLKHSIELFAKNYSMPGYDEV